MCASGTLANRACACSNYYKQKTRLAASSLRQAVSHNDVFFLLPLWLLSFQVKHSAELTAHLTIDQTAVVGRLMV